MEGKENNNETISDSFKKELEIILSNPILDPAYKRKKLIFWIIRTSLSVVLYIIFWEYNWVRWSLLLAIPLSLASLFLIVGSSYIIKRKIEKTTKKIEEVDRLIKKPTNEE